jgi:hypothetical protein
LVHHLYEQNGCDCVFDHQENIEVLFVSFGTNWLMNKKATYRPSGVIAGLPAMSLSVEKLKPGKLCLLHIMNKHPLVRRILCNQLVARAEGDKPTNALSTGLF